MLQLSFTTCKRLTRLSVVVCSIYRPGWVMAMLHSLTLSVIMLIAVTANPCVRGADTCLTLLAHLSVCHMGHCWPMCNMGQCWPMCRMGHCWPVCNMGQYWPMCRMGHCWLMCHMGQCWPMCHIGHCWPVWHMPFSFMVTELAQSGTVFWSFTFC